MDPIDWTPAESARGAMIGAQQAATGMEAAGMTLADNLRQALGERLNTSPIAQQSATARADYMSAAPKAREWMANEVKTTPYNPSQINRMFAEKQTSALIPMMTANIMQEGMYGTMEDLVDAGANAWQKEVVALQGAARIAADNYNAIMQELQQKSQEQQARAAAALAQREFGLKEAMQPYEIEYTKAQTAAANRSNKGGGGGTKQTESELKRSVYAEAAKLPNNLRKEYIQQNGFNTSDAYFSDLLPSPKGVPLSAAGSLKDLGLEGDYKIDTTSGRLVPKPAEKAWWKFW